MPRCLTQIWKERPLLQLMFHDETFEVFLVELFFFSIGDLCHGRKGGWGAGGEQCIQIAVEKGVHIQDYWMILNTRLEKSQETTEVD